MRTHFALVPGRRVISPESRYVITCAATDDVTAWCLLAAVVALVKAGLVGSALFMMVLGLGYVGGMLKAVCPLLARLGEPHHAPGHLPKAALPAFFFAVICSSFLAEAIGIHALFGAFLAGAIMPSSSRMRETVSGKIRDVAVVLLLALFFVFTGLRTEIGLLNTGRLWLVCATISGTKQTLHKGHDKWVKTRFLQSTLPTASRKSSAYPI